eukprot:549475-Pyramimonas_sp.AAC.1
MRRTWKRRDSGEKERLVCRDVRKLKTTTLGRGLGSQDHNKIKREATMGDCSVIVFVPYAACHDVRTAHRRRFEWRGTQAHRPSPNQIF